MGGIDRRKFITIAGLTAASAVSRKLFGQSLSEDTVEVAKGIPEENALRGNRWAMAIDVRKCMEHEECTKCADACHLVHNVPKFDNPKDEIKWIWKEDFENAFPSQESHHLQAELKESRVLILCNHCDNPPCVRVCPTKSTWQREDGIVMMDMHRCIGCRYCVAACPYGARSFNWKNPRPNIEKLTRGFPTRMRGVVEKCNFCAERLARGNMPACYEACEEGAMYFGDLEAADSKIREILHDRFSIRRKPTLGTNPQVYYLV